MVPDLAIPKAAPLPVVVSPPSSIGSAEARAEEAPVDPKGATSLGYATPEAPSLFPPAPRPVTAAPPARATPDLPVASAAPRAAAPAAPAAPTVKERSAPSRLAPEAALPGVMLAASPSAPRRPATQGMYGDRTTRDVADMSPLIGLAVVGLVAILGTGLLMQLAHRPEGWPVARFPIGPTRRAPRAPRRPGSRGVS